MECISCALKLVTWDIKDDLPPHSKTFGECYIPSGVNVIFQVGHDDGSKTHDWRKNCQQCDWRYFVRDKDRQHQESLPLTIC